MFVEQRVYTLKPGAAAPFLDYYAERGREVQFGHLGVPVGYYVSEIGTLNQLVTNWVYNSLDERMAKRQQLAGNADWQNYLEHARQFCTNQQTTILRPAPFFTEQLKSYVHKGGRP